MLEHFLLLTDLIQANTVSGATLPPQNPLTHHHHPYSAQNEGQARSGSPSLSERQWGGLPRLPALH